MIIDVNVDERHLNTGQDEIEAPRAKNPGKCKVFMSRGSPWIIPVQKWTKPRFHNSKSQADNDDQPAISGKHVTRPPRFL